MATVQQTLQNVQITLQQLNQCLPLYTRNDTKSNEIRQLIQELRLLEDSLVAKQGYAGFGGMSGLSANGSVGSIGSVDTSGDLSSFRVYVQTNGLTDPTDIQRLAVERNIDPATAISVTQAMRNAKDAANIQLSASKIVSQLMSDNRNKSTISQSDVDRMMSVAQDITNKPAVLQAVLSNLQSNGLQVTA